MFLPHCAVCGVCQLVSRRVTVAVAPHSKRGKGPLFEGKGEWVGCSVPWCPFGPTVHTAEQHQQQQQGKERVCGHPAHTCTGSRIRHAHMQAQTPRDTIVVSLSAMLNASAPCVVLFLLLLRRSLALS